MYNKFNVKSKYFFLFSNVNSVIINTMTLNYLLGVNVSNWCMSNLQWIALINRYDVWLITLKLLSALVYIFTNYIIYIFKCIFTNLQMGMSIQKKEFLIRAVKINTVITR